MIERFIEKHPQLYHMAEAGSWDSIKRHGLLSTVALLDLYGVEGEERNNLLCEHRPESVPIEHPVHERAVLRNHHRTIAPPMLEPFLLDGLTPQDWYETLNRRCFFWVNEERLNSILNALPYLGLEHDVLILDTRRLVERNLERITVSHINSGYAGGQHPAMRGNNTFHRIQDCYGDGHQREVVELTVEGQVANIAEVTIRVERRKAGKTPRIIWPAPDMHAH